MSQEIINIKDIDEKMILIKGSDTDYITLSGKVYSDCGNNMFRRRKLTLNKYHGYLYVNINYKNGKRNARHHRLVAEAFIPNPNNYPIVGHKDNDKTNNRIENLYWTTYSENTQKAYTDGLIDVPKGSDCFTSYPIIVYDKNFNEIGRYGSIREAGRATNTLFQTIAYQAKNKTISRGEYIFRYQNEENIYSHVIVQYDIKTHEEINRFSSIVEAEKATKIKNGTIRFQLRNNVVPKRTKSGTYFLYKDIREEIKESINE